MGPVQLFSHGRMSDFEATHPMTSQAACLAWQVDGMERDQVYSQPDGRPSWLGALA